MEDFHCSKFGIPARLHSASKECIQDFDSDETFFRRYNPSNVSPKLEYPSNVYSTAISFESGMSVNRGRYSAENGDVLFNVGDGRHFADHHVLALSGLTLQNWRLELPEVPQRHFVVRLAHDPTQCMYPHSTISLFENGNRVDDVKPKALKLRIKRELAKDAQDLGNLPIPQA
jgi:hypothetical protein